MIEKEKFLSIKYILFIQQIKSTYLVNQRKKKVEKTISKNIIKSK